MTKPASEPYYWIETANAGSYGCMELRSVERWTTYHLQPLLDWCKRWSRGETPFNLENAQALLAWMRGEVRPVGGKP